MAAEGRLPARVEVVDEVMAEVLRRKTPAERLAIAFGMWESAREMLTSHLKSSHPEWSEEEVRREVARRFSHGTVGSASPGGPRA